MIFLAGSLDMNGGSTFLIRFARASLITAKKIDIVVLNNVIDREIQSELEQYANVIPLSSLVDTRFRRCGTTQLAIFLPFNNARIEKLLEENDRTVHAMGIFGVVYAFRLANRFGSIKVTAGVYHQNEFAFNSSLSFVRQAKTLFASLPAENIVFFNEYNRDVYSNYFKKDYSHSALLPIGVSLPQIKTGQDKIIEYGHLVSVGNLVDFKTYNEHVIRSVSLLTKDYPQLRYDIYGEGNQSEFLKKLVIELGLESVVAIHHRIPYSNFKNIVERAMGFIGSGTALLEAAALKVPSIVGIESIKTPETYGFLSDVVGYSYNEKIEGMKLTLIKDILISLLNSSASEIQQLGERCAAKAREFSIEKTVDGFGQLKKSAKYLTIKLPWLFWLYCTGSFLVLALLDVLNINKKFRLRRDHSSVYK